MALTETTNRWRASDPDAEIDAVDVRLETFRAALDDARRNGWRESDRIGADLEEYLAAVRTSRREARFLEANEIELRAPNNWLR
jgi:hypothetical protein